MSEAGAPPPLEPSPPGAAPAGPPLVPVRATVASAWRLLLASPRAVVLPSLAIQVPVSIVIAATTAILFFTEFSDEPYLQLSEIDGDTARGVAFALIALAAVQVLFGQVARAATIVAVAAAASGNPKRLVDALDPAFTRMGAIVAQGVVLAAIGGVLVFSIVGLLLFPYVAGRLGVSTEVMMLENQRPIGALAGSWRLLGRRVTRFLGVLVLTALICLGPLVLVSFLGLAVTGSRDEQVIWAAIITVIQAALLTPVVALLTAAGTLFYLKAREIDSGRRVA